MELKGLACSQLQLESKQYSSHTEEVEACLPNCSFLILESCVKTAYHKFKTNEK